MTMIHRASALGPAAASTSRASRFFGRCWCALQERHKREMSRAVVRELSDRQLAGIGMTPTIELDPGPTASWVRLEWI